MMTMSPTRSPIMFCTFVLHLLGCLVRQHAPTTPTKRAINAPWNPGVLDPTPRRLLEANLLTAKPLNRRGAWNIGKKKPYSRRVTP